MNEKPMWYICYDQRDDFVWIEDEYPDDLRAFEYVVKIVPQ